MTCILFQNHLMLSTLYLSQKPSSFCWNLPLSRFSVGRGNLDLFPSLFRKYPLIFAWKMSEKLFVRLLVWRKYISSPQLPCMPNVVCAFVHFPPCRAYIRSSEGFLILEVKVTVLERSILAWMSTVSITQHSFPSSGNCTWCLWLCLARSMGGLWPSSN